MQIICYLITKESPMNAGNLKARTLPFKKRRISSASLRLRRGFAQFPPNDSRFTHVSTTSASMCGPGVIRD